MYETYTFSRGSETITLDSRTSEVSRGSITADGSMESFECVLAVASGNPVVAMAFAHSGGFERVEVKVTRHFDGASSVDIYSGMIVKQRAVAGGVELVAAPKWRVSGWSAPRGTFTTRDWVGLMGEDVEKYTGSGKVVSVSSPLEFEASLDTIGSLFSVSRLVGGVLVLKGVSTPVSMASGGTGDLEFSLADYRHDISVGDGAELICSYDGSLGQAMADGRLGRFSGFPYLTGR